MKIFLIALSMLIGGMVQAQSCRNERSIGADYLQAKYNCEVIIKGNATNCQPYGNMWGCSCSVCPNGGAGAGNFTRTIGSSYGQARYNCEIVLKGMANDCQPSTNGLWYCSCNY